MLHVVLVKSSFIMQTGELNVFFWKQQPLWTTVLQIVQFVSLVVGLVFTLTSLGLFASLNNEFREDALRFDEDKYCILFVTDDKENLEKFSEKQNCLAVVWGQASVAILILVLMILLILHMLFLRFAICISTEMYTLIFHSVNITVIAICLIM